ncbi:TolC family protein [Asaia platycodi]|uniref:TolC family protein n=1 Tax=Asaia platycodi TaxID=610243 RepID=UPI001F57D7DD|nr:TolC family protein [Asaia platycodi]
MRRSRRVTAAWFATALLAGCTMGPDFRRPDVIAPTHYGQEPQGLAGATYGGPVDTAWWKLFNDAELNRLIERLAVQNIDLQRGMQRIQEARSQTRIAAAQGLPNMSWAGSYTRTHQSETGFISLVQPRTGAPNEYDFFQNTLGASWDLDLFGQIRRAVEAQHATQEAAVEARHGLALSTLQRSSPPICSSEACRTNLLLLNAIWQWPTMMWRLSLPLRQWCCNYA